MTATERIRKHRAKLREQHCTRLEVWIGAWIVEGIRQLAKKKGRETWLEVQDVRVAKIAVFSEIAGQSSG